MPGNDIGTGEWKVSAELDDDGQVVICYEITDADAGTVVHSRFSPDVLSRLALHTLSVANELEAWAHVAERMRHSGAAHEEVRAMLATVLAETGHLLDLLRPED